MKAKWNNQVIAESNDLVEVEGNQYFPKDSIKEEYFIESTTTTNCPWKGEAKYFTLKVEGAENKDAVWYYPEPKKAASNIKGRVAFWKGVQITSD